MIFKFFLQDILYDKIIYKHIPSFPYWEEIDISELKTGDNILFKHKNSMLIEYTNGINFWIVEKVCDDDLNTIVLTADVEKMYDKQKYITQFYYCKNELEEDLFTVE